MYSSTFIFAKRQFDDTFHQLDQDIATRARAIAGYLGEESWENPASGLVSNVYYWQTLEALRHLVDDPRHAQAKAAQGRWLAGYRVVIAEVMRTYGDGALDHLLPPLGTPGPDAVASAARGTAA